MHRRTTTMRPRVQWMTLFLAFVLLVQCIVAEDSPDEGPGQVEAASDASNANDTTTYHEYQSSNTSRFGNDTRLPSISKNGLVMPKMNVTVDVDIGKGGMAVGAIVVGFVLVFGGIIVYRPVVAFYGFILGGMAAAKFVGSFSDDANSFATGSWIGFFIGGMIVAGITFYFGKFLTGVAGGVLLAFSIHMAFAHKISPDSPNAVLVVLCGVLGLAMGGMSLKSKKPVVIFSTAYIGATSVAWGFGHFCGHFPDVTHLTHYENANHDGSTTIVVPSEWLMYLGLIMALLTLGVIMQYHVTVKIIKRFRWKMYYDSHKKLFGKKFKKHHRHGFFGSHHHYDDFHHAHTSSHHMPGMHHV